MELMGFENFLNAKDWDYAYNKTVEGKDWGFHGQSNPMGPKFWFMDLTNDTFFTEHMFDLIQKKTAEKYQLDRVYANGHTYGLSGGMHTDREYEEGKEYCTLLYYPCKTWSPDWGGYTILLNKQNSLTHIQPVVPNVAIMFDSTLMHCGLEPTRHCHELRVSIAFKLTKLGN